MKETSKLLPHTTRTTTTLAVLGPEFRRKKKGGKERNGWGRTWAQSAWTRSKKKSPSPVGGSATSASLSSKLASKKFSPPFSFFFKLRGRMYYYYYTNTTTLPKDVCHRWAWGRPLGGGSAKFRPGGGGGSGFWIPRGGGTTSAFLRGKRGGGK